MRFISQSLNGISRVLQKLLKYFNGTAISTYFVGVHLISRGISFFVLDLNKS